MKVGLYSQCMGGNSQYEAISRRPDLFENVLCMCSPMVVSMAAIYSAMSELQGVSQYQELIDLELLKMGGFMAAEMTPHHSAPAVKMPVLMVQVLKDSWTRNPEDAQKTFDLLGSKDKELFWIEGTTKRFKDGYNYVVSRKGRTNRLPNPMRAAGPSLDRNEKPRLESFVGRRPRRRTCWLQRARLAMTCIEARPA